MKKSVTIVAAAMAGLLGFGGVAIAEEYVKKNPSPTFADLFNFEVVRYTGNDNPDADAWAKLVTNGADEDYQAAAAYADTFDASALDDATNAAIFNVVEGDEAVCHEIVPLVFAEYGGGALNVKATFPTDFNYLLCTKVAVLISVMDADGNVTNYVVEGTVTDQGVVQFHINAECAAAVADGTAYIAIFSAE
jgi:hypothetical protein